MAIEPPNNPVTVLGNDSSTLQEPPHAPSSAVSSLIGNSTGGFADSVIVLPDAPVQSYAQRRLNTLFDSEVSRIKDYTDEHWKTPEFPLARIKKIMRIDDDVKMISGEVPVLLSKAIELFVTELTLRSWMLTEDSKRRTVQRSDIAMAIAKNDMFDFLIDIVPREEINSRNRTDSSVNQSSMLTPELIQLYLQLLAAQNTELSAGDTGKNTTTAEGGKTMESGTQQTPNAIFQQQLQLMQQIAQLQQQLSKTPVTTTFDSTPQPAPIESSSIANPPAQAQQSHRSLITTPVSSTTSTTSTGSSDLQVNDCLTSGTTSDLILPTNSLAPVAPFLSELGTVSQFNSSQDVSQPSTNTHPAMTGPNVQRYVINPGDQSGLHSLTTPSSSAASSSIDGQSTGINPLVPSVSYNSEQNQ